MTKNTKWTFIYLLIFTSFQKLKELKSHDWICCDETLPHLISCVLFFFILLFLCRFFIFTLFCVWKAKMNQIKKQLQTQKKQTDSIWRSQQPGLLFSAFGASSASSSSSSSSSFTSGWGSSVFLYSAGDAELFFCRRKRVSSKRSCGGCSY